MYFSLIFIVNIAFSVYHTTYPLLYIEIYFYNMYFVILCYYLIFNVFKRIKWMRALIACFIGFLSLIYLLILIDSFIQNVQTCKCIFLHIFRAFLPYHELCRCFYLHSHVRRLQIQLCSGETQNLETQQNAQQRLIS
jgi:hypothetical protein